MPSISSALAACPVAYRGRSLTLRPNPPQQQAVEHTASPLLVLAGAGSGKTRVITQKISWLVHQRAVSPGDIAAITFTNKAAREMKQRLKQLFFDAGELQGLTVSTFHSLGLRMIRSESKSYGLRSGFSIIDPRDSGTILSELLKADSSDRDVIDRIAARISAWKNQGLLPDEVEAQAFGQDPIDLRALATYGDYQRYLNICNSVDLNDLILLPVLLLKQNHEARNRWRSRLRYLLVDEYQDTNNIQYQLVKLLAGEGNRLTVVGDDDQSIYAWRGAQPQNLVQLGKDFPNLQVIKLEQNYRSCGRILKLANHLISHNPRPFSKRLWSDLGYGDPVAVIPSADEEQEAEKVVSAIMRHQFQRRSRHGDFAILYRGNHQAKILEIKLREMRIPYRISGGLSFFDRSEIRDLMAYLRLLTNPSDDSALLRIINTPRRGIGAAGLEKLALFSSRHGTSLFHALTHSELGSLLKPRQVSILSDFAATIETLSNMASEGSAIRAVEQLIEQIHYKRWLYETCEADIAERRMENVNLLVEWLRVSSIGAPGKTLSDLVNELILDDLNEQQQEEDNTNLINLMTLHAAKGLEFPHVFIVGVEDDILPHKTLSSGRQRAGGTAVILCRHHPGQGNTDPALRRKTQTIRRDGDLHTEPLPERASPGRTTMANPQAPEQTQQTARAHLANIRARRAEKSAS